MERSSTRCTTGIAADAPVFADGAAEIRWRRSLRASSGRLSGVSFPVGGVGFVAEFVGLIWMVIAAVLLIRSTAD